MSISILTRALTVVAVASAVPAWAQHEGHTAAGSQATAVSPEQLATCVRSQQQVMALVDAGNRRLESARQTNDAAAMRAAVDDFQTTLSAVKMQLASCAQLAAAAPAVDPHAGHVMPPAAPAQTVGNVAPQTSTSAQAAAPSQDHAAHAQTTQPAQKPATQGTGTLDITLRSTPSPARGAAENQFEVTVKDRQGKPVDGADVSVSLYMPAMPAMKMPEMRNEVKLKGAGNGRYTGAGQVMMAGQWTATVSVKQNGKEIGQQKVTLTAK